MEATMSVGASHGVPHALSTQWIEEVLEWGESSVSLSPSTRD